MIATEGFYKRLFYFPRLLEHNKAAISLNFSTRNRDSNQSKLHYNTVVFFFLVIWNLAPLLSRVKGGAKEGDARRRRRRNLSGPVRSLFRILLLREWAEKDGVGNSASHPLSPALPVYSSPLEHFRSGLTDNSRIEEEPSKRMDGRGTDLLLIAVRSFSFPAFVLTRLARSALIESSWDPLWASMYIYTTWRINRRDATSKLENREGKKGRDAFCERVRSVSLSEPRLRFSTLSPRGK